MEMIGEAVSEAELGAMLNMADIDQDGRINYEGNNFYQPNLQDINIYKLMALLWGEGD